MSSPAQTLGSWNRIPLETWMSVRFPSVFVLSFVDRGFAAGLITHPRSPTVDKIHSSRLILMGKQARGPNTKGKIKIKRFCEQLKRGGSPSWGLCVGLITTRRKNYVMKRNIGPPQCALMNTVINIGFHEGPKMF
jgi:hypothetical protein